MEPVAYVRSTRTTPEDDYWGGLESELVLTDVVTPEALAGIETFSHAEIVFYFDRLEPQTIARAARHPRGNVEWPQVGIFAQRGSPRPNRIGCTMVRILAREGRVLRVAELDAIDQTPVLDIKPVFQEFLPRGPVIQPAWSHGLMARYWAPWGGARLTAPGPQPGGD
jgi:tRNA-Thr(GGU) m(6)t(6)A37 methyltransferase TsaA